MDNYLFWIPKFKYELVLWLKSYNPLVQWEKKPKKQLLAIYIKLRKKGVKLPYVPKTPDLPFPIQKYEVGDTPDSIRGPGDFPPGPPVTCTG